MGRLGENNGLTRKCNFQFHHSIIYYHIKCVQQTATIEERRRYRTQEMILRGVDYSTTYGWRGPKLLNYCALHAVQFLDI